MPTRYYPQNTNTDGNCDFGSNVADHDLSKTQGTTTGHNDDVSTITSFSQRRSYQLDVSGDSPLFSSQTYNLSIDISLFRGTNLRFQICSVDRTGCLFGACSGTHTENDTGAAVKTFSLTLNFASGDEDLLLTVEGMEATNHGNRDYTIDVQDVDTWVEAPWPVAGGGQQVMIGGLGGILGAGGLWLAEHAGEIVGLDGQPLKEAA